MKEIRKQETEATAGGLDPRLYDTQLCPEPSTTDPVVVIDYNPPQQPQ